MTLFARSSPNDPPPAVQMLALAAVLGLLAIVLMPWLWALLSSFKPRDEIMSTGFLPERWQLANYVGLLNDTLYLRWLLNSIVVSLAAMALGMVVCAMGGFAFAKYDFAGKSVLFWIVIASVSIPPFTTVIPLFGWLARLGMLNTYPVLVLPFAASAFGLFMMRQYMATLPNELIEAARIDGCGEFRIYWSIVMPLLGPALGTLGLISFIQAWNNFLSALVVLRSPSMYTLPLALRILQSPTNSDWGAVMAGSAVAVLPLLVLFAFTSRRLIDGLTTGAVKA